MPVLPMINSVWRVPVIVFATGVLASLSVAGSLFDGTGRFQHSCARNWGRFICWVSRVKVDVQGAHRLDSQGGYVFTANHLSMFDHWAFLSKLPFQFRFAAKASLFKIPFLGWHLRRAGNLLVDRSNHRLTVRAFKESADRIRRGISFVIYPEGGRTLGEMAPFKRGSFLLPFHAEAPIVPVTILGAHKRLKRGSVLLRPGKMHLIIHPPIFPDQYRSMTLSALAEHVQGIIAAAYREVD